MRFNSGRGVKDIRQFLVFLLTLIEQSLDQGNHDVIDRDFVHLQIQTLIFGGQLVIGLFGASVGNDFTISIGWSGQGDESVTVLVGSRCV